MNFMSSTCACTNRKITPRVDARPPMGDAGFKRMAVAWAGVTSDCREGDPGGVAAAAAMPASRVVLKKDWVLREL